MSEKREIKFQAYHKPDIELGEPIKFIQKEIDNKLYFVAENDEDCKYEFYVPLMDDNFIIQQYTGIKDANGREIYDGDIIIDQYYAEKIDELTEDEKCVVKFNNDNYGEVLGWNLMFYSNQDKAIMHYYGMSPSHKFIVIGNVLDEDNYI